MMQPRLIFYGDLAMDVVVQAESFPALGQDAIVDHLAMRPGGAALNSAVVASRLGGRVELVGLIGKDLLATSLLDYIDQCGIGKSYIRRVDGSTAVVIALVSASGERSFLSFRGANASASYGPIAPTLIQAEDCLHVSGYSFQTSNSRGTALALIAQAREQGARISLDPSYHFSREFGQHPHEILSDLDYIFPNQQEAAILSGASKPDEAATVIRALGPRTVVVKMGAQGCYIDDGKTRQHVPGVHTPDVADTTGAGDTFCAAFLAARLWGLNLVQSARVANATAAFAIVEHQGQRIPPKMEDLLASDSLDSPLKKRLEVIHFKLSGRR